MITVVFQHIRIYQVEITMKIDHIFYINLDKRTDRDEDIKQEIKKLDKDLSFTTRFSACVYHGTHCKKLNGAIGCSLSHLEVLKICQKNGYENCIVLEDDFTFIIPQEDVIKKFEHFFSEYGEQYDMLLLGTHCAKYHDIGDELVFKVTNSQTTSGYIINKKFYSALIANIEEGVTKLMSSHNLSLWGIDMYWKKLQDEHNIYTFNNDDFKIGKQRPSFSDIEGVNVDYNA